MDNFSIICNILCAVIWSANFGVVVNKEDEPGIIKVLYAICTIGFTAAACWVSKIVTYPRKKICNNMKNSI